MIKQGYPNFEKQYCKTGVVTGGLRFKLLLKKETVMQKEKEEEEEEKEAQVKREEGETKEDEE